MTDRKIIQLQPLPETEHRRETEYILCDDGTAWKRWWVKHLVDFSEWEQIHPPSQSAT